VQDRAVIGQEIKLGPFNVDFDQVVGRRECLQYFVQASGPRPPGRPAPPGPMDRAIWPRS